MPLTRQGSLNSARASITRIEAAKADASALYRHALKELGLIGSMSAPANPYNNAQAESFMKTLKMENIYVKRYETFNDLATRLPYFMKRLIYSERRTHLALGYQLPNHFETQLARQAA